MKYRAPSKLFAVAAALLATVTFIRVSFGQAENNQFPPVISSVTPSIPLMAVAVRLQGNVVVELTLDSDGRVRSAIVVSGHPILQEPTKQAALKWTFAPAIEVSRIVRLVFVYPKLAYGESALLTVLPYRLDLQLTLPELVRSPETENQIPKNWRPGKDRCTIHGEVLTKDSVGIVYGLAGHKKGYFEAQQRLFRNANTAVYGGCVVMIDAVTGDVSPKFAEVLYCSKCRIAEKKWSYRNRHKSFSA